MMYTKLQWIDANKIAIRAEREDGTVKIIDQASRDLWTLAEQGMLGKVLPYEPPPVRPAQRLAEIRHAVSSHIHKVAQSKDYDSAVSIMVYANSTVPLWRAQALAFIEWNDTIWLAVYKGLNEYKRGVRELPTVEEVLAALPVIQWPEEYRE